MNFTHSTILSTIPGYCSQISVCLLFNFEFNLENKYDVFYRLSSNSVDKIYLKEFLEAANINLSDVSDHVNSNNRTYRKIGVVLHVMIDYRNADKIWFGTGYV